jgi:hypothetical protein
MTDPFADLERELLSAHARDLAPRRHLGAAPRVFAVMATGAALALAVVWIGGRTDAERVAGPQNGGGGEPATTCDRGFVPPGTDQAAPSGIPAEMGIFREGRPPSGLQFDAHMVGAQATRIYRGSLRILPPTSGYDVFVVIADIVPRRQIVQGRDHCAAPVGTTEPGVCMVLSRPKGATSACFTLGEIEGGRAYLDTEDDEGRGRVIGFAADSAREATAGSASAPVESNLFTLPGGPRTEVRFRE